MKLFPKLALMVSGLLLGTILSVSLSYYWAEQREIRQEAHLEEQRVLQNLVHIAEEASLANDDLLLVKYVRMLPKWNSALVSASVVDPLGQIIAHSEPERIGHANVDIAPKTASLLVLSQGVRMGAALSGTASVNFSQERLEEALREHLRRLQRRLAMVTGIGLLLSLGGCFAMAISWTRPIKRLKHGAQQVGEGKWQLDLGPVMDRGDELGFLAKAFQEMALKLQELNQLKEDFVSSVTHELRSPLGAIESYLNLIDHERPQGIPESIMNDYLLRIRVNTQRLTRFINDLLDVAALERGKVDLQREAFDVRKAAREVLQLFEAKICEKKITCELEGPATLPKVWADADKVQQILINLFSNAMKFTPEGGHVDISVEDLSPKKFLRICVTDTGMGISEKDQLKIFSKFEQVQDARAQIKGPKGTGLGLSICRELVQLHGGEIGVTSRLGQGSTFFFTLPAAEAPVPAPI
jgi:signal transduction histidine kinase